MRWYFYPVEKSEDKTIVTETTYTDSKNFVKSTKDQRGNETTYAYNEQKGTLTSTTNALGRTTSYTYDPNNNSLLSVSSGGMTNSYAYENDRLKTITVNGGLRYAFEYDAFGRTTNTKVGNGTNFKTLSSLEYNNKGLLGKQTYGNGDYIDFTYDNLDRITEKKYNGSNTSLVQYAYDSEGRTSAIKDIENSRYTRFTYDLAGRVVRNVTYPNAAANSAFITDMRYGYESKTNRLSDFTYRMPRHGSTTGDYRTADFELIYGTGADADRVTALQMHHVNRIEFAYDGFGRVTSRTYSNTSGDNQRVTTYTYQDVGADKTTTLLKTVNNSGFGSLGYEYDAVGNITQITKDGAVQESYTYDDLNQLKTVTRNGVTTEYNYQNGNITSVTQNSTAVKTYGYTDSTWSDLLTSFNGQTITYDEIGNPLQYRDGMSFTWAKGRQLQGITKDGLNASYTYDENGLRISKTVNGVTTKIFRTNGQMVGMNMSDGKDVTFILDGDGNVYGVHYDHYSANGLRPETYYFAFNAQGDVIGIYDFGGRLMATYDYDEWGNCTVNVLAADSNGHGVDSPDHVAHVNPFRYRGYFYDAETGFYYLNSRYYDPGTGRFINGDGLVDNRDLNTQNLFQYCANNPVNNTDSSGQAWYHWAIAAAVVVGCAVAVVATAGGAAAAIGAVVSVACGGVAATTASTVAAGAFIGASVAFGVAAIRASMNSQNGKEFAEQGNWGTVASTIGGAAAGAAGGYVNARGAGLTTKPKPKIQKIEHTVGMGSPNNNVNINGSYTKLDNNGNIYSYTQFNSLGRQSMRIDFQGRAHKGVLPHIHIYVYPEMGGRVEYTFDMNWHLID